MKHVLLKLITVLIAYISFYDIGLGCTNITVKAKDGSIIVARSLEFGPNLKSNIISSPRGRLFKSLAPNGKQGISWKSKYGYLLVDYFNTGNTLDGMNEKGLSFGYLYLPGYTEYQKVPKGKSSAALPYTILGDWVLGNFSNISEVKKALKNIYVFAEPLKISRRKSVVFPLHAIVNDQTGKSIVIEFYKGKMKIYDSPSGIMTNSPTYDWQLNNLKNYANLTPYSPSPIIIDGYTYTGTGQGSGLVGLPGDPTAPSRFIKATIMKYTAMPVRTATKALILSEHIMNAVDIPYGLSRGKIGSPNIPSNLDRTQWVVFKDMTHLVFYFRSYNNLTIQMIDMKKINFAPGSKQLKIPIKEKKQIIPDATSRFLES